MHNMAIANKINGLSMRQATILTNGLKRLENTSLTPEEREDIDYLKGQLHNVIKYHQGVAA